jgi:hypothetical protein
MTLYRTTFYVHGNGIFPLDMLRYDSCYPHDSYSVHELEDTGWKATERREVSLIHTGNLKDWTPTIDRWASFGWIVADSVSTRKVA